MSETLEPHILARFEVVKLIGGGAYGYVWRVVDRLTRRTKALKKNYDAFNNNTDAQRTYREIMFLSELSHPAIIRLEEVIKADNDKDIYLVFEHMDVDLHVLIREKILSDRHRKFIIYQVACALHYLHSAGLIHRDVKPANVLLNEECEAKLCDFGLVRSVEDDEQGQERLTEYIATRWYRAPELLLGTDAYSKAVDIWSFGCLIAEMYKGKALFAGTSTVNQLEKILQWTGSPEPEFRSRFPPELSKILHKFRGKAKELLPGVDPDCLDLLEKTLRFDPQRRVSITEVLHHPFLAVHFKASDIVTAPHRIKVAVDDNDRLSLKEYRSKIYEQIRSKSLEVSTIYRIKPPMRRPRRNELMEPQLRSEGKTLSMGKSQEKNPNHRRPRHLKTIEKEWDLEDDRKDHDWLRKKRSTTEAAVVKKPNRTLPTRVEFKEMLLRKKQ